MADKTKWTPGPWCVARDGNAQANVYGADGFWVALLPHQCITSIEEQQEHHAALIAAAPDLYEALEDARRYVSGAYECAFPDEQENERVLDAVDAALAKARGESNGR